MAVGVVSPGCGAGQRAIVVPDKPFRPANKHPERGPDIPAKNIHDPGLTPPHRSIAPAPHSRAAARTHTRTDAQRRSAVHHAHTHTTHSTHSTLHSTAHCTHPAHSRVSPSSGTSQVRLAQVLALAHVLADSASLDPPGSGEREHTFKRCTTVLLLLLCYYYSRSATGTRQLRVIRLTRIRKLGGKGRKP